MRILFTTSILHDKSIEFHESKAVQASQTGSVFRHKRFEMNPFS